MFISIHIPKTAGTTVAYILDYGMKRRIMYDYREDYSAAPPTQYLLKHEEFIRDNFDIIHGHFHYRKYAEAFPDAVFLATVRHPVARVVSQYNHNLNLDPETSVWPARDIIDGKMDLVEFASIPEIGNAQSLFLSGRSIKDYGHIFITEHLLRSFEIFQRKFNFTRNDPFSAKGLPVMNSNELRPKKYAPPDELLVKVYKNTSKDNDLYRECVQVFLNGR